MVLPFKHYEIPRIICVSDYNCVRCSLRQSVAARQARPVSPPPQVDLQLEDCSMLQQTQHVLQFYITRIFAHGPYLLANSSSFHTGAIRLVKLFIFVPASCRMKSMEKVSQPVRGTQVQAHWVPQSMQL